MKYKLISIAMLTFAAFLVSGSLNPSDAALRDLNPTINATTPGGTGGYRFTPTSNGNVTHLWCYGTGTHTVSLWNSVGTKLATASVSCNNVWGSTSITPVALTSGQSYYVTVFQVAKTTVISVPQTTTNFTINNGTIVTPRDPVETWTSASQGTTLYGLPDITFSVQSAPTSTTTNAASSVTSSTATLNGSAVNNADSAGTGYFRYSATNPGSCNDSFGTRAPSSGGTSITGYSPTSFNQSISGLSSSTTYYYCAIANNALGTSFGSIQSFTTSAQAPTISTNTASGIAGTYATLNATYNTNGASTTIYFKWGTTNTGSCSTLANTATGSTISNGSGTTTYSLSSLAFGTTYYYCAYATNAGGTTYASNTAASITNGITSFTTSGCLGQGQLGTTSDYTVSSSCGFVNTIDGVDAGSGTVNTAAITIAANQTLTINSGQTVVSRSLIKNAGGKIVKSGNGKWVKGTLFVADADNDGIAPSAPTVTYRSVNDTSSTSGYRRLNAATLGADCNDENNYVYQSVGVAPDADNDGYISGNLFSTQCVGGTSTINGRSYYRNSSGSYAYLGSGANIGNNDCNDSSASVWATTTFYRDADNDTYGLSSNTTTSCGSTPPAGYVTNTTDCYDSNANAKPGQTLFFSTNRGDGSFDYNCDSTTEHEALYCPSQSTTVQWWTISGSCMNSSMGLCSSASQVISCGSQVGAYSSYMTFSDRRGYWGASCTSLAGYTGPWSTQTTYTQTCR